MQHDNRPKGIAREPRRHELTGIPTSTWYDLQNAGKAPKPIKLGVRSVGWMIEELEAFVEARRAERDGMGRKGKVQRECALVGDGEAAQAPAERSAVTEVAPATP
jgi:prophage regulatory protein